MVKYRRDVFVRPGELPVTFTIDLAVKDLELALELADSVGAPIPQAELNTQVMRDASAAGLGEADMGDVAVYLRTAGS